MADPKVTSKLKGLARKWSKKNNKFNSGLIGEIHELVFKNNAEKLVAIGLIQTQCFENLLWKFYDEDSSFNHIELVLVLAIVKFEREEYDYFDEIITDSRFDGLFSRLLSVGSTNYRLGSFVLQFISILISKYRNHEKFASVVFPLFDIYTWTNCPGLVTGNDKEKIETKLSSIKQLSKKDQLEFHLKNNWFYSMINQVTASKSTPSDFQSYFVQLLRLLVISVTQEETNQYFNQLLIYTHFAYQVRIMLYSISNCYIQEMDNVLLYYLYFHNDSPSPDLFYQLQIYLSTKNDHELALIPSIDNIQQQDWKAYLGKMNSDELIAILDKFNMAKLYNTPELDILVEIITSHIFPQELCNSDLIQNLTEVDLLDNFEIKQNSELLDTNIPMSHLNFTNYRDYFHRVVLYLQQIVVKEFNNHIRQVFSRIENSNLQIKGKSKYFHHITSISKLDQGVYEFNTKDQINSKFVVLIELIVPTKFSKNTRMSIHGINLLRFGEVVRKGQGQVTIKCNNAGDIEDFEERIKYFISVPDTQALSALINLLSYDISKNEADEFENADKLINEELGSIADTSNVYKRLKGDGNLHQVKELNQDEQAVLELNEKSKTLIVQVDKLSRSRLLVEKLYQSFEKSRTLIVAPNSAYVNQSEFHFDGDFIRYGSSRDIKRLKVNYDTAVEELSKVLKYINFNEEFELSKINYITNLIKTTWNRYLNNYDQKSTTGCPFDDSVHDTFESIVQSYLKVLKNIQYIKLIEPIAKQLDENNVQDIQMWNYLYNKFPIVITSLKDYVKNHNSNGLVLQDFDNLVLLFGKVESLAILLKNNSVNRVKRLIILGGKVSSNFDHQEITTISDTRSEFTNHLDRLINPPTIGFNPGFQLISQTIKVANQLEEAEYCILLYQYMRLLGYPSEEISIWVSSLRQRALIDEIIKSKFVNQVADDSKDSFEFGWPQVICNVNGEYNHNASNYVIESLHTDSDVFPITSYMGKLGNWSIGEADLTVKTPVSAHLQIHTNENYWSKQRSQQKYNIESKEHLEQYVEQMTKTRTNK